MLIVRLDTAQSYGHYSFVCAIFGRVGILSMYDTPSTRKFVDLFPS